MSTALISFAIALPFVVIFLTFFLAYRAALYVLISICWLPWGRDVLFVNSDSPVWHEYMDTHILPLVQNRAVVLNWSEKKKWSRWSLAPRVFRSLGGNHAFNPLVVVFRPLRPAKVFRFWAAFKDWKHGRMEEVERLTEDLKAAL